MASQLETSFYTVAEAAQLLNVKPRQIRRQAHLGRIPFTLNGNRIRIPKAAYTAWLKAQSESALAACASSVQGENHGNA